MAQIILVGFICFLCPGMFNALNGMGGGGQLDETVSAKANTGLNSTFAIVGFFAGTFLNYFGAKITIALGGLGYAVYAGSYLSYNHNQNIGFVVFAGCFLGICAGLLWCAQGTVMMSYPAENEKGKFIGIFWAIFNTGAVLGSLIPLGTNWNVTKVAPVKDGTYIGFVVLMLCGAVLAFFLVSPDKIVRRDGTRVQPIRHPSAWAEIYGMWTTVRSDPYIILLFPFFWASNWFYTYQQNCYNLFMFNPRSRAFTGMWYWLAQTVGALAFGFFLDNKRMTRRTRAIYGLAGLFVVVNSIWGGGTKALLRTHRPTDPNDPSQVIAMDVFDRDFTWYCLLYVFYGFQDAIWQTYAYWLMGALSNDPHKLAYFAGFYKGIQSAGAAVAWALDTRATPYSAMFGTSWGFCALGMICAIPVVWKRVRETEVTAQDFVATAKGVEEIAHEGPVISEADLKREAV